jgi:hypothetical protein
MGQSKWRRFFALMGTVIAKIEGAPPVPNTSPNPDSVKKELKKAEAQLDVVRRLDAYNATLKHVNERHILGAHYYLVKREPRQNRVMITGFKSNEPDKATEAYARAERLIKLSEGEDGCAGNGRINEIIDAGVSELFFRYPRVHRRCKTSASLKGALALATTTDALVCCADGRNKMVQFRSLWRARCHGYVLPASRDNDDLWTISHGQSDLSHD